MLRSSNVLLKTWCYLLCGCRLVWVAAPQFPSQTEMLLCHVQPRRTLKLDKNLSPSISKIHLLLLGFVKPLLIITFLPSTAVSNSLPPANVSLGYAAK